MTAGAGFGTTEVDERGPFRSPRRALLFPLTRLQRSGLVGLLIVSAIDIALSSLLFFGPEGGFVEANPLLAWAAGGLLLFLVVVLAAKAIGIGLIALLISFANRFGTLAGDAVLLAALCTTMVFFLLELVTVGVVPAPVTACVIPVPHL